jgi:hypothetical protein
MRVKAWLSRKGNPDKNVIVELAKGDEETEGYPFRRAPNSGKPALGQARKHVVGDRQGA